MRSLRDDRVDESHGPKLSIHPRIQAAGELLRLAHTRMLPSPPSPNAFAMTGTEILASIVLVATTEIRCLRPLEILTMLT